MHRFYTDKGYLNNANKDVIITGEDVNHIKNVLRLRCGDTILVSDGEGTDYRCRISALNADSVVADIEDVFRNSAELPVRIILFQGMPKSDKLELIIQKAVELGAAEIVPVLTKRSVVKIDEKKAGKKIDRYNMIAMSAGKQSGRGIIPEVKPFMTFSEALSYAGELDMSIIPYEEAKGMEYSREVIEQIRCMSKERHDEKEGGLPSLGIFIGPEGGFAKEEVGAAMDMGAKCITLGSRILRTETAGLAVLSVIMFAIDS